MTQQMSAADSVTVDTFNKLPKGSRLLLAYVLVNDLWEMQLMKTDRDAASLVSLGWLKGTKMAIHGMGMYEITPDVMDRLDAIADDILRVDEEDLQHFVARKGKEYPWLW